MWPWYAARSDGRGSTRSPRLRGSLAVTALGVAALGGGPRAAGAQQPAPDVLPEPAAVVPLVQAEPEPGPLEMSPRGALVRALLLPGWGHASIGAYTRGGFYFALETATAYALVRTGARLSDARERAELRESVLRARYANEGITDPAEIAARLEADEALQSVEDLVSSREAQREDLLAWGIFLVLIAGADAYVSAHLARFPAPIDIEAAPTPEGGAEVSLRVPFP